MRRRVLAQLRAHPDRYSGFVLVDFGVYVASMARLGTWGDHVTLQVRGCWVCVCVCVCCV